MRRCLDTKTLPKFAKPSANLANVPGCLSKMSAFRYRRSGQNGRRAGISGAPVGLRHRREQQKGPLDHQSGARQGPVGRHFGRYGL